MMDWISIVIAQEPAYQEHPADPPRQYYLSVRDGDHLIFQGPCGPTRAHAYGQLRDLLFPHPEDVKYSLLAQFAGRSDD